MKKYYAVEYMSGKNTTIGQPNKTTGRYSRAVHLSVFSNKQERDAWVDDGKVTSAMQSNCRRAVTKTEARNLHLGMSVDDFEEHVEYLLDAHKL